MCFVLHLCKKTPATTADVENECLYLNMLVKPDKYIITQRLEERTSFCSNILTQGGVNAVMINLSPLGN